MYFGYQGIVYDREPSGSSDPYKNNKLYWLDKIDYVRKQIADLETIKKNIMIFLLI